MAEYSINKGIGRTVEYKGLKAQWFCIAFGAVCASILVWLTFHLNAKYGQYGLMKLAAVKYHPRYIINRLRLNRLIRVRKQ